MRLLLAIALLFALLPLAQRAPGPQAESRARHYPDGTLRELAEVRTGPGADPQFHGAYTSYWPNGERRSEGHYRDGQMHGPWRFYDEQGRLAGEAVYEDGRGIYTAYDGQGRKLRQGPRTGETRQGEWVEWYPDGRVRMRGGFVDDEQHGRWVVYTEGTPADSVVVFFEHGERVR